MDLDALVSGLHYRFPYGAGARKAECALGHIGAVGVAHPHAHRPIGCIAHHHSIAELLAGACLGGCRAGNGETAPLDSALGEDIGDQVGVGCRHHLQRIGSRILVQHCSQSVLHRQDGCRIELPVARGQILYCGHPHHQAVVGEDAVRIGVVEELDLAAAKGEGRPVPAGIAEGGDTHLVSGVDDPFNAYRQDRPYGCDVDRLGQGCAYGDRPLELEVPVLDGLTAFGLDIDGLIPDYRCCRPALEEGGQIGVNLDGGAWRALGGGDVHLTLDVLSEVVAAAHHRQDLSSRRLDDHRRAVVTAVAVLDGADVLLDDRLRFLLQRQVEAGRDPQAGAIYQLRAIGILRQIQHPLLAHLGEHVLHIEHKVGRVDGERPLLERQLLLLGLIRLLLSDIAVLHHQAEDLVLAAHGLRPVLGHGRGVIAGGLRDPGQHRRFRQGKVPGRLAEVAPGGGLSPGGEVAVEDLVQVPLQDLVITVAALQLKGQDHLLDLPAQRPFSPLLWRDVDVLHQLLSDGAAAAALQEAGPEGRQVLHGGPQQSLDVHSWIVVEAGVLGGDGGVDEPGRDLRQGDGVAQAGQGIHELVEQVAVAVEDAGASRAAASEGDLRPLQIGRVVVIDGEGDAAADGQERQHQQRRGADQPEPTSACPLTAAVQPPYPSPPRRKPSGHRLPMPSSLVQRNVIGQGSPKVCFPAGRGRDARWKKPERCGRPGYRIPERRRHARPASPPARRTTA